MSENSSDFFLTSIGQVSDVNFRQGVSGNNSSAVSPVSFDIDPDDPIIGYFQAFPEAVEIGKINLNSPTLERLKLSTARLVVPLIHHGKLIGLINLGEQIHNDENLPENQQWAEEQEDLAVITLRIAHWMRQHKVEVQDGEELEHELTVARIILETLLPSKIPEFSGWKSLAHWQPAKSVGGDFYDFIHLKDGRLGLIIGDVTDQGIPTSLVMAITKNIIHAMVRSYPSPGEVLSRINNLLYPRIPSNMFVTCLYAILDPKSGILSYANAGHDLPICRRLHGLEELRATGMPLGLLPDMDYEEGNITLEPGDAFLLYSDGLIEAHNPTREMFGVGRIWELVEEHQSGEGLVDSLLTTLCGFTGDQWEQEDDITLVLMQRDGLGIDIAKGSETESFQEENWKVLGEFSLPSEAGIERVASEKVLELLIEIPLKKTQIDRLKTAVSEATMNAIEHGNHFDRNKPVIIKVIASEKAISVHISDRGGDIIIPESMVPDLEAKLAGLESPRGWGMFIIRKMVDHLEILSGEDHHTVVLSMFLEGDLDAS
jgi:serine phosphatase RsbU (regulator of sigma subunit)/anti-sigma regulatory factor (Ser/Thr protein kinase)